MVSSDFGQLVGIRHLMAGIDCAIAGAATAVDAARPTPAAFRNSRRFIRYPPCGDNGGFSPERPLESGPWQLSRKPDGPLGPSPVCFGSTKVVSGLSTERRVKTHRGRPC